MSYLEQVCSDLRIFLFRAAAPIAVDAVSDALIPSDIPDEEKGNRVASLASREAWVQIDQVAERLGMTRSEAIARLIEIEQDNPHGDLMILVRDRSSNQFRLVLDLWVKEHRERCVDQRVVPHAPLWRVMELEGSPRRREAVS